MAAQGVHRIARPVARSGPRRRIRPHVVVVAPEVVGAVRRVGGWLFDQATAGWDVTVLAPGHLDARPLHILGAHTVDLDSALVSPQRGPLPQVIAIDAGLCATDAHIRRRLLDVVDAGQIEVVVWGEGWPADPGGDDGSVRHRPSSAALAFKAQALAAAAAPVDAGAVTERFRTGEMLRRSGRV